jgi:tetratricopeptide (TPR) repeat protein
MVMLLTLPIFAQKGVEDGSKYGQGEDSIRCIKNLSLYREMAKQGAQGYADAMGPWRIVYSECPSCTKNIYIDGAKMFNLLISNEKDPARKAALMDTLKGIYDQRINYFQQKGSVLGRKAVDILRHEEYRTDPVILEEAYGYLKESIDILKKQSSIAVVATYNGSSHQLYDFGVINDQKLIEDYALVSDIIDYQLSKKPDDSQVLRTKDAADVRFINSSAATCNSMLEYFQKDYDSKKDDLTYLKKAVRFLGALECEEDPFYATVAETLYAKDPSAEAAFGLARLFLKKKDYNKAVEYYKEAIDREEDNTKKGEYLYQLAFVTNAEMKQPQQARTYALEAIQLKPDWGEPYILIGDTYASAKECFEDDFEKTTVYWVAVDKFLHAKSIDGEVSEKADERISTYKKYFPDVESIFFYSLKEGDSYTVGCWINETTKVRAR